MSAKYVGIDDEYGRDVWSDVDVQSWVSVQEWDQLHEVGYIDLDGLVVIEYSDDHE